MANQKPKPAFASGLYIALALCILAVVCIGAISAVSQLFQKPALTQTIPNDTQQAEDAPNPELSKTPDASETPDAFGDSLKPITEDPAEEIAALPAEPEDSAKAEVPERVFSQPAAGEVSKEFLVDALSYSVTMEDYRAHTGIDIAAAEGSPVVAFTDGVVESIHVDPLMGQTVVLNHGDGLKSIYQNLSETLPEDLEVGASVASGALLGAVGDTAIIECAEPSHLHFELTAEGVCVNPGEYLTME